MKKTLVKLGVLAAALALALVVVSCEQPTDEGSSGPGSPTIIRLYLDRDDGTIAAGDTLEIRVGEELLIPGSVLTYPIGAAANTDSALVQEPGSKFGAIEAADRNKVIAIPWDRSNILVANSVISGVNPKKKYLLSGKITAKIPVVASDTPAGGNIQVNDKGIYYIDIPLVNETVASKDRGSIYAGSISGYVELRVNGTGGTVAASLSDKTFLYTKDKHGFNDLWKIVNGTPLWDTRNTNIKKVSLKSGINELYLSYFSNEQSEN